MKVTLVIPTLNESEGLKKIMPQIKPEWYDQLVILDGNSNDNTTSWCEEQGYTVYTQNEKGLWNGYKELFKSGLVRGDIIVTFSPDGNSVPELIPRLIDMVAGNCDMAIASRYSGTAKSYDDSRVTAFGNKLFNATINLLLGTHFTDALVMFRAYRREIIEELGFLEPVPKSHKLMQRISHLASWEPSLSIRCARSGLRVAEVSCDEPERIDGKPRKQSSLRHGSAILGQILYEILIKEKSKNGREH